jgi:hypothetical protein
VTILEYASSLERNMGWDHAGKHIYHEAVLGIIVFQFLRRSKQPPRPRAGGRRKQSMDRRDKWLDRIIYIPLIVCAITWVLFITFLPVLVGGKFLGIW